MTDRPIIFSAPMVRALLDGRKTQTRRLATSPLRRVEVGDRLYVREHWKTFIGYDDVAPRDLNPETIVLLLADSVVSTKRFLPPWGKHRQGMHMPRWASRLTLIVEGVTVEPLQAISEESCIAEGAKLRGWMEGLGRPLDGWMVETDQPHAAVTPRFWFRELWDSLHTADGERWSDNPYVVALTLRVVRGNIDRIAA